MVGRLVTTMILTMGYLCSGRFAAEDQMGWSLFFLVIGVGGLWGRDYYVQQMREESE